MLVVVDTPAGSPNKYKYDAQLRAFRISRILPAGLVFPCDFGSVPGTCAQDGDALDVLVVGCPPTFPGCIVPTRLLGLIYARQTEGGRRISNDRLIACAETPSNKARYTHLRQLEAEYLRNIEQFFAAYNRAAGREFQITGRGSVSEARAALSRAVSAFRCCSSN